MAWILTIALLLCLCLAAGGQDGAGERRPQVRIRGIYGGVPTQIFDRGQSLEDYGVNAVWIGSGSLTAEKIALLRAQGARVFAEFNSMHEASFLKEHPDAAPVGRDGKVCPPPSGWQGICPTHPGYRKYRMDAFRQVLRDHAVDGIWLDYHHSHASWEQAVPELPDTCFCQRCLAQFAHDTGTSLPELPAAELPARLLGEQRAKWVRWRCDLFTDWVREFRAILDRLLPSRPPRASDRWRPWEPWTRERPLLGTFHCPWSDTDFDRALTEKLAIDLKAQARYVDAFSPMPYHARFGHAGDPAWISRQTAWLGRHLASGRQDGQPVPEIWPIVQLSDWGEAVPATQVREVLDHGTRPPATGVMVFAWGRLHEQWEKVEAMCGFYRAIR